MSHGNVIVIKSSDEFNKRIKQATGLVVVDWSASWCGPCKRIMPTVAQYSVDFPDTLFLNVDVDDQADLAAKYDIRAMPTFMFFKNGQLHDKMQGADSVKLGELIEKYQVKSWGGGRRLGGPDELPKSTIKPSSNVSSSTPQQTPSQYSTGDGVGDVLLGTLLEMGFSFNHARTALTATNNASLEAAIDW